MLSYSENLYNIAPLLKIETARYILCFNVRDKIKLYELAPLFRSRMGMFLKRRFCEFSDFSVRSCNNCNLSADCFYTKFFAPGCDSVDKSFQGRGHCHTDPPRPYTLTARTVTDEAAIVLTLFGRDAVSHSQAFTAALTEAAESFEIRHIKNAESKNREKLLENLLWYVPKPKTDSIKSCCEDQDEVGFMEDAQAYPLHDWVCDLPAPCEQINGKISNSSGHSLTELHFPVPFQADHFWTLSKKIRN